MMQIYCHDHHETEGSLCTECRDLLAYAIQRLDNCPFGEQKPACNHCEVHCYSAVKRDQVKTVMRYAGPRMLLHHPILAISHLLDTRRPVPHLKKKRKQR